LAAIGWIGFQVAAIDNIEQIVGTDGDRPGPAKLVGFPSLQEFAAGIEDLDARVVAVGDVDQALRVDGDTVWQIEFTVGGAFASPIQQELAIRRKLGNAVVAIAVGDVDASVGSEREVRREIKVCGIEPRRALCPNGEEQFAVMRKLEGLLQRAIGKPDVVLAVDAQAVRFQKTVLSPGGEQFAGSTIEAKYGWRGDDVSFIRGPGVFSAVKHEHMVVRVHGNSRNLAKHESIRELRPAVHHGVWFAGR